MHWICITNLKCYLSISYTCNFHNLRLVSATQMVSILTKRLNIKTCVQVLHAVFTCCARLLELEDRQGLLRNSVGSIKNKMTMVVLGVPTSVMFCRFIAGAHQLVLAISFVRNRLDDVELILVRFIV